MSVFKCPFCDHSGSDGWMHLRDSHPNRLKEWFAMKQSKQMEEPVEEPEPDHESIFDMPQSQCTITRRLEFDAGHRIYGHESKCANIHGHRYVALIQCTPVDDLDDLGRVVDFSVIKTKVGGWIDECLDHGMILYFKDPLCDIWRLFGNQEMKQAVPKHDVADKVFAIEQQKCFFMNANPTAENIAKLIYLNARDCLEGHGIRMVRVRLYETPNCYADYSE